MMSEHFLSGLFPKAVEYKSFNRVSNPYECDIGGTYIKFMQQQILLGATCKSYNTYKKKFI